MKSVSHVSNRLVQWGEECVRRADHGTGFPKQVAWCNGMPPCRGFGSQGIELSSASHEVEKCMVALRVTAPQLYRAVCLCYLPSCMTPKQKAADLQVSVSTYYTKVDQGEQKILGYLNDVAAGVELPAASVNAGKRLVSDGG